MRRDQTRCGSQPVGAPGIADVLSFQRAREIIFELPGAVGMIGGTESFVAAMKRDDVTS